MQLIDTHAHLTYEGLVEQLDTVLQASRQAGVVEWITIGTDREHIEKVMAIAPQYNGLWAALGIHPHYANEYTAQDVQLIEKYLSDTKVVAVGETGLDYHYDNVVHRHQRDLFCQLLELAVRFKKPVIVHTRLAFEDTMAILSDYDRHLAAVVIHCYGGDAQQTECVLQRGYFVSFTGTITFKKSQALREVAKMIPPQRVMLETDCPFISPEPVRRIQPNQPALMVHTARCLAEIYQMPLEEFAALTFQTSRTFFKLTG